VIPLGQFAKFHQLHDAMASLDDDRIDNNPGGQEFSQLDCDQ
jgi:hypothetical protein